MSEDTPTYNAPVIGSCSSSSGVKNEPEAAALRNDLRQIGTICERNMNGIGDPLMAIEQIDKVVSRALSRKKTNGVVIDQLKADNLKFENQVIELQVALHEASAQPSTPPPAPALAANMDGIVADISELKRKGEATHIRTAQVEVDTVAIIDALAMRSSYVRLECIDELEGKLHGSITEVCRSIEVGIQKRESNAVRTEQLQVSVDVLENRAAIEERRCAKLEERFDGLEGDRLGSLVHALTGRHLR